MRPNHESVSHSSPEDQRAARRAIIRESLIDQQIALDIAERNKNRLTEDVDSLSSDELRAIAEEKLEKRSFRYQDMVDIATAPQCPIDVTINILMDIYTSRSRRSYEEHDNPFTDSILSRIEKILYDSNTPIDVIEYIADNKDLYNLSEINNYEKAKEIQKLARKIFRETGATRMHKIEDEVSKRQREKEERELKEFETKAVEDAIASANSPLENDRQRAADSIYCPINILTKLALEDPNDNVRIRAARNKNHTSASLRAIYNAAILDNNHDILLAVFENENCSPDIALNSFEEIRTNWDTVYGRADWTKIDVIKDAVRTLIEKIDSPKMPIEALEELRDKYRYSRPPLRKIFIAARDKLVGIHLRQYIGRAVPNPERFPSEETELSEAEKLKKKQEELEQKRQENEAKKERLKESSAQLLEALKQVKQLSSEIEEGEAEGIHIYTGNHRVTIPDNELFMTVDDHREINPEYLPYIDYIDFSLSDTANLKVSGIDWSRTNIRIDPQTVYGKNLSGARFSDDATTFGNFEGCDLTGCDIQEELESYGFDAAIIDSETKLPPYYK